MSDLFLSFFVPRFFVSPDPWRIGMVFEFVRTSILKGIWIVLQFVRPIFPNLRFQKMIFGNASFKIACCIISFVIITIFFFPYLRAKISNNWVCRKGKQIIGHSDAYIITRFPKHWVCRKGKFGNWALVTPIWTRELRIIEFTEKVNVNIGHSDAYLIVRIPKKWVCRRIN